jgi:hypothetical protein
MASTVAIERVQAMTGDPWATSLLTTSRPIAPDAPVTMYAFRITRTTEIHTTLK